MTESAPRLRKDAERNRRLLVAAAVEVFSEQGLNASLDEIARRAGVGNATLYRRFPARADLYAAVYAEGDATVRRLQDEVLRIQDAWIALVTYFEGVSMLSVSNRALCELMMTGGFPGAPTFTEKWREGVKFMGELIGRAHDQGVLRPEVTVEDIGMALCSVQQMIPSAGSVAPNAWRRHLAFTLDGLRARGVDEPGTPSLTDEQLHGLVQQLFLRDSGLR